MKRKQAILLHILVWAFWLLFFYLIMPVQNKLLVVLLYGCVNISIFYIAYWMISKTLFNKRQYISAFIKIGILLLAAMAVKLGLAVLFEKSLMYYGENMDKRYSIPQYLLSAGIVSAFFILLSFGLRLANNSYRQEQMRKNLENQKLSAELAFLKSQINPHFLFNTLNNIYSLAYKKSDKTPEAVLKLADMMRYMLQDHPDNKVSLEEEINYLKNYIDLQQLRFQNPLAIDLKIHVKDVHHRITPLLLISFVENAFKHGATTDPNNPIRILIEMKGSRLHFKISNLKNKQNKDTSSGIGLANLQRRLELVYPDQHTFHIYNGDLFYTGELFIYLQTQPI